MSNVSMKDIHNVVTEANIFKSDVNIKGECLSLIKAWNEKSPTQIKGAVYCLCVSLKSFIKHVEGTNKHSEDLVKFYNDALTLNAQIQSI